MTVFATLDANMRYVREAMAQCGDFVMRDLVVPAIPAPMAACVAFIDQLADARGIGVHILSGIGAAKAPGRQSDSPTDILTAAGVSAADFREEKELDKLMTAMLSGDTVLFLDGKDAAVVFATRGFPSRGVPKADLEAVVQGPQEAFSEVLRTNTTLLRRRIRDTRLKVKQSLIGRRSATDVALVYLDDVARPDIVSEAEARLAAIDIDAVQDIGYVEQLIEDDWLSPFPQTQLTERPDKAAAAILEGRVAIIADNSPFALLLPATLNASLQASEDYYQRFHITMLVRPLRFTAAIMAAALPGLYLALAVFHPSMLPMMLMFKMAGARALVPFPAVAEILLMELAFELLREAGVRLPGPVGGAIGIVGGLIVGQAAVEAGLVSPAVVIIVAITGIAGFASPDYRLASALRLVKYLIIALASMFGLFGFWMAMLLVLVHLASLKSFGVPYLHPFAAGGMNGYADAKDSLFRLPLFAMRTRPFFAAPGQRTRMKQAKRHGKE